MNNIESLPPVAQAAGFRCSTNGTWIGNAIPTPGAENGIDLGIRFENNNRMLWDG